MLFFDLVYREKKPKSYLNSEQNYFFLKQRLYCLTQKGTGTRVIRTKRFSGWLVIKLHVRTF